MIRTQVLKHLLGAKWSKRENSKGDIRGGATAKEAMKKCRYVGVIEEEEVKGDDLIMLIECFLPTGVESTF